MAEEKRRKKQNSGKKNPDRNQKIHETAKQKKISDQKQGQEVRKGTSCPYAGKCGGCGGFKQSYEEQLAGKQAYLRNLYEGLCPVEPVRGMYYPLYYRNKVHRVFGVDAKGKPAYGMYAEKTHKIIPVKQCMIEDRTCQKIIDTIWELLPSFRIKTYDEDSEFGFLRHVIVRRGFSSGEILVVLVTAYVTWPGVKNFCRVLMEKHPEITSIVQNVNDKRTTFLLGERNKTLVGRGFICDRLLGVNYVIGPTSFYQINSKQTEVLYRLAIEAAGLTGDETVLDAYCGIGTIGMTAAKSGAGQVLGVELNAEAAKNAQENAKAEGLKNLHFLAGDATEWMQRQAAEGRKVDVIFLDPPRSGTTKEFVNAAAGVNPDRIVYVSCEPETQVRDLRLFRKKGYEPVTAWPVDMFPGTKNTEVVVLLSKKDSMNIMKNR